MKYVIYSAIYNYLVGISCSGDQKYFKIYMLKIT